MIPDLSLIYGRARRMALTTSIRMYLTMYIGRKFILKGQLFNQNEVQFWIIRNRGGLGLRRAAPVVRKVCCRLIIINLGCGLDSSPALKFEDENNNPQFFFVQPPTITFPILILDSIGRGAPGPFYRGMSAALIANLKRSNSLWISGT